MSTMSEPAIAYILKGFPRHSEAFITSEIVGLARLGLDLRVFSAFPGEAPPPSESRNLHSPVTYLPEAPEAIDRPFGTWLKTNGPRYVPFHLRLLRAAPSRYRRSLTDMLRLSLTCRNGRSLRLKKVFYKDFLRAGSLAWPILQRPEIRHLHAHFCHGATTMAMFASSLTGLPFSFTAHAKDLYLPKLNPGTLLEIKIHRAAFVVTCTEANRTYLHHRFPAYASKIHRVYHGVDTVRFAPARPPHPDVPLILSIGRHVRKKGHRYLVHACARLRDRGYAFRCLIVGASDEDTPFIRQTIDDLDLSNLVTLEPERPQDALRPLYHRATLFALACHIVENGDRDGIPNVVAEAMASGLPVVTTRISGIPELITDGRDGFMVPEKDPDALARAIERLLLNPGLRRRMGVAARERVETFFDAETNLQSLRQLFHVHVFSDPAHDQIGQRAIERMSAPNHTAFQLALGEHAPDHQFVQQPLGVSVQQDSIIRTRPTHG